MPSLLEKETTVLFDRAALLEALGDVLLAVPKRSPKPILLRVKLDVRPEDGSTLSATDLEVGIVRRVLGVKADAAASLLLPPDRLGAILRGADDAEVALAVEREDRVTVRGRRWHFTLPAEDPASYPSVPPFAAGDYHEVAAADLRTLIRRTACATDPESTRYALGGVLVEPSDDAIEFIGTDGRRLARQRVAAEPRGRGFGRGQAVVPLKALKLIERALDAGDAPVQLASDAAPNAAAHAAPSAVFVRTERAVIYTRLVEGRFPRYQDVFPSAPEAVVTLGAGTLLDAAVSAAIATSDETRGVDFAFAGGTLTLSSAAADVGEGRVEIDVTPLSGGPVTLSLDPRYLTDALRTLDRETVLRVEIVDARAAVVLRAEDGYTYVVMPLTLNR